MAKEIKSFIGRVVKNGNSYHISIPAYIKRYENIEQGDILDLGNIKLIKKEESSGERICFSDMILDNSPFVEIGA